MPPVFQILACSHTKRMIEPGDAGYPFHQQVISEMKQNGAKAAAYLVSPDDMRRYRAFQMKGPQDRFLDLMYGTGMVKGLVNEGDMIRMINAKDTEHIFEIRIDREWLQKQRTLQGKPREDTGKSRSNGNVVHEIDSEGAMIEQSDTSRSLEQAQLDSSTGMTRAPAIFGCTQQLHPQNELGAQERQVQVEMCDSKLHEEQHAKALVVRDSNE